MKKGFHERLQKALDHFKAQKLSEAGTAAREALALNPKSPDVHHLLGVIAGLEFRHKDAEAHLLIAANLDKRNPLIPFNLAKALSDQGRHLDALIWHQRTLYLSSRNHNAWINFGLSLSSLKRFEEAVKAFDRAISINPHLAEAYSNKATCLNEMGYPERALSIHDYAVAINPELAEAWVNRGVTLTVLRLYEDALKSFEKALQLRPEIAENWSNVGVTLAELKRHTEAAAHFFSAHQKRDLKAFDFGRAHHQMMLAANWKNYEDYVETINSSIVAGHFIGEPFGYQAIATSEALLKKCAEIYCEVKYPEKKSFFAQTRKPGKKIRLAYLCGEFRDHATSHLMAGVWELHDKENFEVYGFDSGWNDESSYRNRIEKSFDRIFDISKISDEGAARLINDRGVDILVNLNGYFGNARQGIFSMRPSPVQINYLGFPGTIGAKYIDYIIADKNVIPENSVNHYAEKVIYMPYSYQANDNKRAVSEEKIQRVDFGIPSDSFVFCCFNNTYKINPNVFRVWIRILRKNKESVLWLIEDNGEARRNIINYAENEGINACRLIFADRVPAAQHIKRHELADLFLDTWPYNAHTTASDALWSGLPVLTLRGNTFPGRVGASLLCAIDLPELVADTVDEYEENAIRLSRAPFDLLEIRKRLAQKKSTAPLFNTELFTMNLERAYKAVHDRQVSGLPKANIYITAS